jgi:hypothetical protein
MKVVPRWFLASLFLWGVGRGLRADVVETKEGARLVGRVTRIADGKVYLDTDYAGVIVVLQARIVRIATDGPVAVRLVSGRRYEGRLAPTGQAVQIVTAAGPVNAEVAEIAATWAAGAPDPQTVRPRYHWSYQASVNVTGKSGNHDQLGSAYAVTATLKRLRDTLILASAYNRQSSDGVKSADQFKVGADYTDNYADRNSWYARDEGGFDHIKSLDLYNTTAVGVGYDVVKRVHQTLTFRAGLAYRYERYDLSTTPDVSAGALDLGFKHTVQFSSSLLTTTLSVVPAFADFNNVIITHETDYDIPLAKSAWKLRLGLSDNYVSRPPPGIQKLDTTWFGSLVWNFEAIKIGRLIPRPVRWWEH